MKKKASEKKKAEFSLISEERLAELYKAMLRFQVIDEAATTRTTRFNKHEGSAAIAAGVLLHLDEKDRVVLSEHRHGHRYLKGERLESALRHSLQAARSGLIPLKEECSGAEQVLIAAGVALALKCEKKNAATVLFVEGQQTAGKEWETALRFAVNQKIGLVIVCRNLPTGSGKIVNEKAGSIADEPGSRSAIKGLPPVLTVDATDCIAVYRVAQEALTHAREGSRPTVIRALSSKEIGAMDGEVCEEPLTRMENYLKSKKLFSSKLAKQTRAEISSKVKSVRKSEK